MAHAIYKDKFVFDLFYLTIAHFEPAWLINIFEFDHKYKKISNSNKQFGPKWPIWIELSKFHSKKRTCRVKSTTKNLMIDETSN